MIVSIGVHILDVLGRHVNEIPPGQGIALIDEIRITAAGTAAGTSVDLAKLGCDVTAVGAVGRDEMGSILLGIMSRHGINTDYIVRKDGVQTSGSMLPIRPNGERPGLHCIGANAHFCLADVPPSVLQGAKFVHIGGFFLMPKFDGCDTVKALQLAKEAGATTTMDVLGFPREGMAELILPCMPYLDYFMPNEEEAAMITGLSDPDAMRRLSGRRCQVRLPQDGLSREPGAERERRQVPRARLPRRRGGHNGLRGCVERRLYCRLEPRNASGTGGAPRLGVRLAGSHGPRQRRRYSGPALGAGLYGYNANAAFG